MSKVKTRIVIIKDPINGNQGIPSLKARVMAQFDPKPGEKLLVVFFTKNRKRCKVLQLDATGVTLAVRMLYTGSFLFTGDEEVRDINILDLRRLLFDGTIFGSAWQNPLAEVSFDENDELSF